MIDFDFNTLFSSTNPVFSGGFGLAIIATGAHLLRFSSQMTIKILRRHFLSTLEITSKDKSYPWILRWLTVRGGNNQHLSVQTSIHSYNKNLNNINFEFVPGPGQHVIIYNRYIMFVQRTREQQLDFNTGKPWEKIQFTYIGKNTNIFNNMLLEAYELSTLKEDNKTIIYTNWGSEWREFGQPRIKRSIESVILDVNIANKLLSDIIEWTNSLAWYHDRGIPYRRGYLLHGPPGSGKSSFIMALAGKLGYNICILNLAEKGLTDDRLALALSCIPPKSLVLLEDIDAAFPNRDHYNESPSIESQYTNHNTASNSNNSNNSNMNFSSDVTFSGLLNVLDGVSSSEERLIFMTTNYIHRLDPALIRPGRVDYVQLIDNATNYQIKQLFERFYPETICNNNNNNNNNNVSTNNNSHQHLSDEFVNNIRKFYSEISMAMLQGHLLCYKNDPINAINNIKDININQIQQNKRYNYQSKQSLNTKISSKNNISRSLTVEQIDKMYFNPQEGWDKNISKL